MGQYTPQRAALHKFIFTIIGLVILFLTPLGTLALGFQLAVFLGFALGGVVPTCIAAFLLGLAFPILAIDYFLDGDRSSLARMYNRFLEDELSAQRKLENGNIKQLRDAYNELKAKCQPQLEEFEFEEGDKLGIWK
jgi:hypothetical protein